MNRVAAVVVIDPGHNQPAIDRLPPDDQEGLSAFLIQLDSLGVVHDLVDFM